MKRMEGFQKPASQPGAKEVGLARITAYGDTRIECSCGWAKGHIRAKVRENAAEKHVNKKHEGRAIWL